MLSIKAAINKNFTVSVMILILLIFDSYVFLIPILCSDC